MEYLGPGAYVLRVFSGPSRVAEVIGITRQGAFQWSRRYRTFSTPVARRLLDVARHEGLDLQAEDLIFGRWVLDSGEAISARYEYPDEKKGVTQVTP